MANVWTFGAASPEFPGNYEVLRDGKPVLGARASKILISKDIIYVLGRDRKWWEWNGSAWKLIGSALPK
jgi:hypothetical protein